MSLVIDLPLQGRHIVVTRPAGQAGHFADMLREQGAIPVLFPVLSIVDLDDISPLLAIATRLETFDLAVFVSPNAVDKALEVILAHRAWPRALQIATMGKSSEQALQRHGLSDIIAPRDRFDSEALLELPELCDVNGRRIVIFRGDAGRELLGDTLGKRGAQLEYVASYRRARPELDPAPLLDLWAQGQLDAVTLTSSEGLRNMHEMLGKLGQTWLRKTPVFVTHDRIAANARDLDLRCVVQAGPGDEGLLQALLEYFKRDEPARNIRTDI